VRVTLGAVGRPGVTIRMLCIHRDHMLVDMIAVRMVKVPIVEKVDVIVMTHRDMTTPFSVDVCVISFMNRM
jgi:hypothetical protein